MVWLPPIATLFLTFLGCVAAWRMLMSPTLDGHNLPNFVVIGVPAVLVCLALFCCALMARQAAHWKANAIGYLLAEAAEVDNVIEDALSARILRLLSGAWLRGGGAVLISRRQDLPEEAFLSAEAATEAYREGKVLVLSYGWLSPSMPDPNGTYLCALRRLLTYLGRDADHCGIFWDYAALPQKRYVDGVWEERSAADEATFKRGLNVMARLYGSFWRTTVVQHKLVPNATCEDYNGRAYKDRGWCCFEEGIAYLAAGKCAELSHTKATLGWGRWAGGEQPKVLEISGAEPCVVTVTKAPTLQELERTIGNATFTGKADRKAVMSMLREFDALLGAAARSNRDAEAIAAERAHAKLSSEVVSAEIIKEGYMRMEIPGNTIIEELKTMWKRLYFVLYDDGTLRYYNSSIKKGEQGSIDLRRFGMRRGSNLLDHEAKLDENEEAQRLHVNGVLVDAASTGGLAQRCSIFEDQFYLVSGRTMFYFTSTEKVVVDEWFQTLQTTLSVLYKRSPLLLHLREPLRIGLMDGTFTTMPIDESTKVHDVIHFMCMRHQLNNAAEWGVVEQWDHPGLPFVMSERMLPHGELLNDQTMIAWEREARSKYGTELEITWNAFQLVLRKQSSLRPQVRTRKEEHLEFCQALADVREGRATTQSHEEIFELAALAIFKDLREEVHGLSDVEHEEVLVLEEGQLTDQLEHYLPSHWFKALELKRPRLQKQQVADWGAAVVRAHNKLAKENTQLNAPLATRRYIEAVSCDPLCFSASYVTTMQIGEKTINTLLVIGRGGLNIYGLSSRKAPTYDAPLFSVDWDKLVSWRSKDGMLMIEVFYMPKGEVAERHEEWHFLTPESFEMGVRLSRYAKLKSEGGAEEAEELVMTAAAVPMLLPTGHRAGRRGRSAKNCRQQPNGPKERKPIPETFIRV